MAHLHFKRTVYKSGGGKASGRVAYITRQPVEALEREVQQLRYIGHTKDPNQQREDLVYTQSRNLPDWAHDNPHHYFQAAERYERVGGVAFEEWKITLPAEFSHRQNMALMHDLVEAIAGEDKPCTYAFHDPASVSGAVQQPHLHLLISARKNDAHRRTAQTHFRRYNRESPARGGAQKDPSMNHMGSVKAHRVLVADIVNAHLEHAGHAVRVHPDRLDTRGIERQPEPKLRPSESREYREQGVVSKRMQQVLAMRAERTQQQRALEQNNARAYWEGRKAELGITRDLPMAVKLERISEARAQRVQQAPERPTLAQLREEERTLEQSVKGLDRHIQDLQHYRRLEQRLEQRREPRQWKHELAVERVLAAGAKHGLPRDREAEQMVAKLERTARLHTATHRLRGLAQSLGHDEPQQGAALRVRLFERDEEERERQREHDRGLGW